MFRKMRRFKQQLPEEQCIKILEEEPRGILAVIGDDGYPYTIPMDHFYEDGKLYFHGAAQGHKMDAIKACDKVSYCVLDKGVPDERGDFYYFNSVVAFGRIRILEDREEILRQVRKLAFKYFTDPEEVELDMQRNGSRVACMELTIEHMTGKHVHEK